MRFPDSWRPRSLASRAVIGMDFFEFGTAIDRGRYRTKNVFTAFRTRLQSNARILILLIVSLGLGFRNSKPCSCALNKTTEPFDCVVLLPKTSSQSNDIVLDLWVQIFWKDWCVFESNLMYTLSSACPMVEIVLCYGARAGFLVHRALTWACHSNLQFKKRERNSLYNLPNAKGSRCVHFLALGLKLAW